MVYNKTGDRRNIMIGEPILVMLVEDNPDHAELVIRTMESHHIPIRILHISDGEAALDYLLRRNSYSDPETSPRPFIILLDLRLPRVDGLEVLRMIKEGEDLRNIPVIILTTSDAEKDMMSAYENYVNSYLVKPVGFEDFSNLMNDLGGYWLGWNKRLR
jgi:CheY-like chemotaxis protein